MDFFSRSHHEKDTALKGRSIRLGKTVLSTFNDLIVIYKLFISSLSFTDVMFSFREESGLAVLVRNFATCYLILICF